MNLVKENCDRFDRRRMYSSTNDEPQKQRKIDIEIVDYFQIVQSNYL